MYFYIITYIKYLYGHAALACLSRALNRADPAGCTALMHACSPIPPSDQGDNEEDEEDGMLRTCLMLRCIVLIIPYVTDDTAYQ